MLAMVSSASRSMPNACGLFGSLHSRYFSAIHASCPTGEAMLTLYLGMLDVDFEVTGPPELVQALGKTADRFLRAIDTGAHG